MMIILASLLSPQCLIPSSLQHHESLKHCTRQACANQSGLVCSILTDHLELDTMNSSTAIALMLARSTETSYAQLDPRVMAINVARGITTTHARYVMFMFTALGGGVWGRH